MVFIEKRGEFIERTRKQLKEWITEHETELEFGGVFGAILLFEWMFYCAAFDRGADVGVKALTKWGEALERCVEDGTIVLMMPTESGKMVKTMDWDIWGEAVSKMLTSVK